MFRHLPEERRQPTILPSLQWGVASSVEAQLCCQASFASAFFETQSPAFYHSGKLVFPLNFGVACLLIEPLGEEFSKTGASVLKKSLPPTIHRFVGEDRNETQRQCKQDVERCISRLGRCNMAGRARGTEQFVKSRLVRTDAQDWHAGFAQRYDHHWWPISAGASAEIPRLYRIECLAITARVAGACGTAQGRS
jgi:hypothetical protein